MIKAVVFDLDDTLYLERDYAFSGMAAIGDWVEQKWGISGFEAELRRLWDDGIRTRTFDVALNNLNVALSEPEIQQMVACYRDHKPNITLQPDARRALEHLHKNYVLGLITDGYEAAQRGKIEALGIRKWIPHILITDTLGRENWKPSHVPYRMMEEALALEGAECMYVGDNIMKDFVAAKERGWHTVQVSRPLRVHAHPPEIAPSHTPHYTAESLDALPMLLSKIATAAAADATR